MPDSIRQMTTPPDTVDLETYKWVYDKAQGYWTPLCPEYPNLYGLTCEDIHQFIEDFVSGSHAISIKKDKSYKIIPLLSESEKRDYIESYLHHVKCLDRIELFDICYDLGTKLNYILDDRPNEASNAYITSPRGGYEVLSIFSYANEIPKECIPMDFRSYNGKLYHLYLYSMDILEELEYMDNFTRNIIIIDDIIASGQQFTLSIYNLEQYCRHNNITYKPSIFYATIATRKHPTWLTQQVRAYEEGSKLIDEETLSLTMDVFNNRTVSYYTTIGIKTFNALYLNNLLDEDHLITLRFPWGSPDGESDQLLRSLYKGRHHEPEIHRRRYIKMP